MDDLIMMETPYLGRGWKIPIWETYHHRDQGKPPSSTCAGKDAKLPAHL